MKRLGRKARPFYRLCAVDGRRPRDGRVLEELGYYDPMCKEVDARAVLKGERIEYWVGVGAQPSESAGTLIKKYGSKGTHLDAQKAAFTRMNRDEHGQPKRTTTPKPIAPAPVAATAEAAAAE